MGVGGRFGGGGVRVDVNGEVKLFSPEDKGKIVQNVIKV